MHISTGARLSDEADAGPEHDGREVTAQHYTRADEHERAKLRYAFFIAIVALCALLTLILVGAWIVLKTESSTAKDAVAAPQALSERSLGPTSVTRPGPQAASAKQQTVVSSPRGSCERAPP